MTGLTAPLVLTGNVLMVRVGSACFVDAEVRTVVDELAILVCSWLVVEERGKELDMFVAVSLVVLKEVVEFTSEAKLDANASVDVVAV